MAWNDVQATDILRRHDGREGALLPILHDMQAAFGCIPQEALPFIAQALNLSRAEVHGVVSFYHDFREQPAGRHVLKLCRAEACQAAGGDAIAERAEDRFQDHLGHVVEGEDESEFDEREPEAASLDPERGRDAMRSECRGETREVQGRERSTITLTC